MALALVIAFFVFVLFGRVLIQLYLTGDHGIRRVRSRSPAIAKLATWLFLGSFAAIATLVVVDARSIQPATALGATNGVYLGGILGSIGILFTIWSQWQMGAAWRVGVDERERTTLVTCGVYAGVRNPIYTGIMAWALGLGILVPTPWLWLTLALLYLSIELQVRYVEEPYLEKLHGAGFVAYRARNGRYLARFD